MDGAGGAAVNFQPNFASCSVESLLSVTTRFIFRETQTGDNRRQGDKKKRFVFSKSEVSTLLRVSMLSAELDAILSLAYDALDRSQKCRAHRKCIEDSNSDPAAGNARGALLRAMLPIMSVHSETAEAALDHATSESFGVSRVLSELESCASDLGKFAEQNHSMADQLDCYMATGQDNILSNEKRAIAEIEGAVVERIENLGVLAMGPPGGDAREEGAPASVDSPGGTRSKGGSFAILSEFCESLFPEQRAEALASDDAHPQPAARGAFSESQMSAAEVLHNLGSGIGKDPAPSS